MAAGELSVDPSTEIRLERPKQRDHGDWATNAGAAAGQAGRPAAARGRPGCSPPGSASCPGSTSVEVAGPGFLNITLDAAAAGELARTVVEAGAGLRHLADRWPGTAQPRVHLREPDRTAAHRAHPLGRLGDALGRLLSAAGARRHPGVLRQRRRRPDGPVRRLRPGAGARRAESPRTATRASTSTELAAEGHGRAPGRRRAAPRRGPGDLPRTSGTGSSWPRPQAVLEGFGVHFDVWFSERTPARVGRRRRRRSSGCAGRATSSRTGTARSGCAPPTSATTRTGCWSGADGEPTYFASDAAYYLDKRRPRLRPRRSTCSVPTTTATCGRLKAIAACAGDDPATTIEVLIGQLVSVQRCAELSKRAGNIVELDDLVEWLGVDAVRYSLARYPADSPLTLDVELLHPPDQRQPGVLRAVRARPDRRGDPQRGRGRGPDRRTGSTPRCSTTSTESVLLGALGEFPRVVASAAELREPHRVARYLEELAGHFHKFYDACRVLPRGDEEVTDTHRTRLWLGRGDPQVLRQRAAACSASAPRSGCSGDGSTRGRGAALPGARRRGHRAGLAAAAGGRQRAAARALVQHRPALRGRRARGRRRRDGRDLAAEFGTPVYVLDEDDFRRGPGVPGRLPVRLRGPGRRRRLLRRQGVPQHRGRPLGRRGGPRASTSAPAASSPSRCGPGSDPARIDAARQQQDRRRARAALDAGVGRIVDRLASTRSSGSARSPRPRLGVRPGCWSGSPPGSRRTPTSTSPTAHEDQKFGFSLAAGHAAEAVRRVHRPARAGAGRAALATSARRSSTPAGFEVAAHRVLGLHAQVAATSTASSSPSSTWAAASASPTPARDDPPRARGAGRRACARSSRHECRGCRHRGAADLRSSRAGRSSARPRVTLYAVGTVKDVPLDGGAAPVRVAWTAG